MSHAYTSKITDRPFPVTEISADQIQYLLVCLHNQLAPAIYSFISTSKAVVRDVARQEVVQPIDIQV